MKIGLLIKQVPLKMKTGADGLMDRSGNSQINPYCKHALEEAIKFKSHFHDGHITVISMGPPKFQQSIHEAISMGADAGILLSDRMLAGSDTYEEISKDYSEWWNDSDALDAFSEWDKIKKVAESFLKFKGQQFKYNCVTCGKEFTRNFKIYQNPLCDEHFTPGGRR